jgi:hypothetical protein
MMSNWTHAGASAMTGLALLVAAAGQTAQTPAQAPAAAERPPLAALWSEPEPGRDLYYGVGGPKLAPNPTDIYTVLEIKLRGYSEGYTVSDSTEREWSVKLPAEATSEVVASRILWAIGYHQPPVYLLREWQAKGAVAPNPQLPSRFREKDPDFHGLEAGGTWSFKNSPFDGTRELAGLLVLQAIIENPDIKDSNNTIYTLKEPVEGSNRWYVVRDLGYSFGRASFNSPRNDIDTFERAPFIRDVVDGKVRFYYGGQYKSRLKNTTVADVHWICQRLARLTDRQWRDAFRAGAYESSIADRYIARLKAKIAEGLALRDTSRE